MEYFCFIRINSSIVDSLAGTHVYYREKETEAETTQVLVMVKRTAEQCSELIRYR